MKKKRGYALPAYHSGFLFTPVIVTYCFLVDKNVPLDQLATQLLAASPQLNKVYRRNR